MPRNFVSFFFGPIDAVGGDWTKEKRGVRVSKNSWGSRPRLHSVAAPQLDAPLCVTIFRGNRRASPEKRDFDNHASGYQECPS
jgi:hypothetical protein